MDSFQRLKSYIQQNYKITYEKEEKYIVNADNVKGYYINENVRCIYEQYKTFFLTWFNDNDKYIGEVRFVPYYLLEKEHTDLIGIMNECYDTENDELNIVEDIISWYPLFYFSNGDAFCLDIRYGTIVFYEHEIFDSGKNLHGLLIAKSINELFEKWEVIHFADVYYWDEIVNDEGIDLECEKIKHYI